MDAKDAMILIDAWIAEQLAMKRQGERLIAVNIDRDGIITSVKGAEKPTKLEPLTRLMRKTIDADTTQGVELPADR